MGQHAQALADRFEHVSQEMIAAVERCSEAQWKTKTAAEGWSVGVVAHHIAEGHAAISDLAGRVATGQPLPALTPEGLDQMNAAHAREHADCAKGETLDLLRRNAAVAAAAVRRLDDDQLERTASLLVGMPPMTATQVIERVLIGHVEEHLGSIRAAIDTRAR